MRELVVAILQTGTASVVALALGIVATKVFAVVLGPAGLGLISLMRQIYQSAVVLGTLNSQGALAQGIASRDEDAQAAFRLTAMWVLLLSGALAALTFLCFPAHISRLVMGREDRALVELVRWLFPAVLAGIASGYFLGLLNGYRSIGAMAVIQIAGAVAGAIMAYPVAVWLRGGHLLAVTVYIAAPAVLTCALSIRCVKRGGWMPARPRHAAPLFDHAAAKAFLRLAGAMLLSGALATSIPLVVRALIVRRFGLGGVGVFDVAWNISMNYVLLPLAAFGTYYVPTLSRLTDPGRRHDLIERVFRLSIVMMVPLVVATVVLKPLVVRALYASAFLPSLEMMRWMLVGDYFKITSWVFAYTMVAYADVKTWTWTEIVWGAGSLCGAVLAVLHFRSLEMLGINFLLVYASWLIFALGYVRSRRHFVLHWTTVRSWVTGLALILAASAHSWNDLSVRPLLAAGYITAAALFSCSLLTVEERRDLWHGVREVFQRQGISRRRRPDALVRGYEARRPGV